MPMGIGELHKEHDKEGQEVDVYDVVIHPDFLRKCEKSSFFKEFFVMLVFDGLADKYSLELNREYKLLKNRKSIGTLTTQNVSSIMCTYRRFMYDVLRFPCLVAWKHPSVESNLVQFIFF